MAAKDRPRSITANSGPSAPNTPDASSASDTSSAHVISAAIAIAVWFSQRFGNRRSLGCSGREKIPENPSFLVSIDLIFRGANHLRAEKAEQLENCYH